MRRRMVERRQVFLVAFSFFAFGSLLPGVARGQEEHRIRGAEVAVFNLAGAVEVVPGSGAEVVVQVMRGGRDASRLEVEVREIGGRQALVVLYPGDEIVYPGMGRGSNTQIRVGADGTFFGGEEGRRDRRVRISGRGDGLEAWADLRVAVPAGRSFALHLAVGDSQLRDLEGGDYLVDSGSGAITAVGIGGDLDIDTGSGSVTVQGVDGRLRVDTGSGAVEVSDVRGEEVELDSGSGSVTVAGMETGRLVVDTGSGTITLTGVSCPDVRVDTGSGAVEVELQTDVESLVVDTGSGSVTLRLPEDVGARVEVDTGSGGIDVDLPLEIREVRRDFLRGLLGDGRGTIQVDTGSGRIHLLRR